MDVWRRSDGPLRPQDRGAQLHALRLGSGTGGSSWAMEIQRHFVLCGGGLGAAPGKHEHLGELPEQCRGAGGWRETPQPRGIRRLEKQPAQGDQRVQEGSPLERQRESGGIGDVDQAVQGQPHVFAFKGAEPAIEGHPLEFGQSSSVSSRVLEDGVRLGVLRKQLRLRGRRGGGDVPEVQNALR